MEEYGPNAPPPEKMPPDPELDAVMEIALARTYLRHLRIARPKMAAQLRAAGKLTEHALQVGNQAEDLIETLQLQGMPLHEAIQQAKHDLILVPTEQDVPILGQRPIANRPGSTGSTT